MDEATGGVRQHEEPRRGERSGEDQVAAIRSDIEQTRVELGETVEALREHLQPEHLKHQVFRRARARTARTSSQFQRMREQALGWTQRLASNPRQAASEARATAQGMIGRLQGERGLQESILRGAIGGFGAAAAMFTMMLIVMKGIGGAKETMSEAGGKEVGHWAGTEGAAEEPLSSVIASLAHLLYGAAWGALYGVLRHRRDVRTFPSAQLFGLAVYAVGFLGWLPALGIVPSLWRQREPLGVMRIIAHLLYGTVMGLLYERSQGPAYQLRERLGLAETGVHEPFIVPPAAPPAAQPMRRAA